MNKLYLTICIVLMVVLCVITYSNHFHNDFHFDDAHAVKNNVYIRNIENIPLFFKDGSTISTVPQNQAYRPVVVASLAFDYWLGNGYNLFYFHLSTFILFILQGILMVFFFNKVFNFSLPNSKICIYTSLIGAIWYLLHPAVAETVNYITARSDLQSTFFVILAFILYIYSPFCRKTYLYNVAIVVGTLAKPTAVMFAPLLFVYILFFEEQLSFYDVFKKDQLKGVLRTVKKSVPAFICCIIMYYWQAKLTPKTWEPGGTSPLQYLITQPFVIFHYFAMFFVPNALSADTDWHLLPNISNWRFFIGALFILVMVMTSVVTSRKAILRPISFGILWFFITLVPTSSIIPLGEVLNDHRMYFPFVGLCISVIWTIALLINHYRMVFEKHALAYRTAFLLVLTLILSGYAYGTYQRNNVWHTEESLWYDVTIQSPENGRGLMNYGLTKMAKGEYGIADTYFKRALNLTPYYSTLYLNIGVLKTATGSATAAEDYFKKAVQYGPNYPDTYLYYGRYLSSQGRYKDAITMFQKSLSLSPSYLYARTLLMDAYLATENWGQLKILAENTLDIVPGNQDVLKYLQAANKRKGKIEMEADNVKVAPTAEKYLNLSLLYYNSGKYEQCIEACKEAIKLKGNYAEAYNNMGTAYNLLKQYMNAVEALKKALTIKPDFELAKNNLRFAESQLNASKKLPVIAGQKMNAEQYIGLSLTYFNQGLYQKCIDACYEALAIKPGYDLAYNNICAAYNKLGQWDKAIKAGEEGIKINPNNQLLKNNLQESYRHKINK